MNEIVVNGNRMILDSQDSLDLLKYDVYEPFVTELIREHVTANMVCVDAGAHIGYYTLLMAKQAKVVHAFEPLPRSLDLLRRNVQLNGYSNVKAYHWALDEKADEKDLYLCPSNSGSHQLYYSGNGWDHIRVRSERLDCVIEAADFIKVDVEGYEAQVLRGAEGIIGGNNPLAIMLEFWPVQIQKAGRDPVELLQWLQSHGFTFQRVTEMNKGPLAPATIQDLMNCGPGYVYTWMER